ncbi:MAG: DUF3224 domain-containing protein [Thermomicrobiales bacterium]
MRSHATGTFAGKSWDEETYDEAEGRPKLSRASVTNAYSGDLEGEGKLEYLLAYQHDDAASFVGIERVVGRIGDKSGSFVLQQSGTYENGVAKGEWFVVPGTGTEELTGLRGEGDFEASHESAAFTLDYEIG